VSCSHHPDNLQEEFVAIVYPHLTKELVVYWYYPVGIFFIVSQETKNVRAIKHDHPNGGNRLASHKDEALLNVFA